MSAFMMVLVKGHMNGSEGHCALWEIPSKNTGVCFSLVTYNVIKEQILLTETLL